MKSGVSSTPRIVLLQGTFDLLNAAHVMAFRRAKAQGDYLIVAINSNRLLKRYKGYDATLPWKQRKTIIEALRVVDKVVRADYFSPINLLKRYKVDVYCCTQEWKHTKKREIAYIEGRGGRVYWLPRFKVMCNLDIKRRIVKEAHKRGWK